MEISVQTLSEQIYQSLRRDIITQKIPCGEKLTLKFLKERFNVSSTPIREALTRLTQDGLVSYLTNVGVKVVTLNETDIREIFALSRDLDCLAVRYSMESKNLALLTVDLRDAIEKGASCLTRSDDQGWLFWSDEAHLAFYRYCENSRLEDAADKIRGQLTILSIRYQSSFGTQQQVQNEHASICCAVESGDIVHAVDLMRMHMNHALQYALHLHGNYAPCG